MAKNHVGREPTHAGAVPADDEAAGAAAAEPQRPSGRASAKAWVDYAVALGYDADQIADLSKKEIAALIDADAEGDD